MHGSAMVDWLLAGLTGVTGLYCLARLLRPGAARAERRLDASEAVKGLGMAAMALPYGLSGGVPVWLWAALFGTAAVWSLGEGLRPGHRGHHLYHAVGHLAMVYMAVAAASGGHGMAGMSDGADAAGIPLLTGALLLFFGGYALVGGVRLIGGANPAAGAGAGAAGAAIGTAAPGSVVRRLLGAPELPNACRTVLGIGMFTMLLIM
ncbi:DUF5134 domain-containing protein [Streptacidiphilus sp. P02-A3a]|uniref:DUF5134 domain-containing protein n=1 Tax=Streptacidiphilus sp. P02-A3a TaxID=2704468 RepID=UPI0015FA0215|nr:DUF5134 domain-containing protein [Streptacidiphilus sp. P02-A3a]QMU68745.1 DUF5134 domain-containing protein [Streptacidiphilus sp. P02-A3a]